MATVGVVGAGAAGLAAALRLQRSGVAVTLYEADVRPGGALRTEELDGARADVGVQLVSSSYTALHALLRDAGAAHLLKRSPGRDALWRNDRAHAITYGSVTSMATSSALPMTLKLKMAGRYLPYLKSAARSLDANDPVATGGLAHDHESIGTWGARELGRDFVELLVYPLLAAYHGSMPERTSAAIYHGLAKVGMDVSVHAAIGGFGALAHALLAAFEQAGGEVVLGTTIESCAGAGSRVELRTAGGAATHDAVVIAVPAPRAAALLQPGPAVDWLSAVQVQPTLSVAYRVDREFPGEYFGLSFPRGDAIGDTVAALCVQGRKLPGMVHDGDALVALPAPDAANALLRMSDDDAARAMLDVLQRAVPGISKRVVSQRVTRFTGYTQFPPGSLRHIARFDPGWLPKGVVLAGDCLVAPGVEGAVRSGDRAAHRVRALLSEAA